MYRLLLVLTAIVSVCSAFNYCSISHQNTLCRFKANVFGPRCNRPQQIRLAASDKVNIVNIHNQLRRRVAKGQETRGRPGPQPPAADMRELIWDDELAQMAQAWANQCTFQHDTNRNVRRFSVGQNLYLTMNSRPVMGANWEAAIDRSWYNEVSLFDRNLVRSFRPRSFAAIGHYSAVVWANTNKVGCAATAYMDRSTRSFPYRMIYVCNYGPTGNFIGAPVYRIGQPASACPRGTRPRDGLCA